jgi:hypothetical protein
MGTAEGDPGEVSCNEKLCPFRSASDAQIIGYREGRKEFLKGGQPKNLERVREAEYEAHPERRHVRGPQILHYRAWRSAFDAGFLGLPRPALPHTGLYRTSTLTASSATAPPRT